jgi:hypothetical protein
VSRFIEIAGLIGFDIKPDETDRIDKGSILSITQQAADSWKLKAAFHKGSGAIQLSVEGIS